MTVHPETARNARPYLTGQETEAIADALAVGQFGHGPATEQFEHALAQFLGVRDVVTVSSCTDTLKIALLVAGVRPGDEVLVPSQTFCATVQAVLTVGASPRFVDIDPDTQCVTARTVQDALTARTRVLLPVLYGGRAVDLTALADVLTERGIAVVEDAAHAFGSFQGEQPVGTTGVLTCFSFGPIKNLTCIEGGALVPRTPEDAQAARRLRTLGIGQTQADRIRTTTYTVHSTGFRATLSAVHAAVGLAQLARFPQTARARQDLWRAYAAALADVPGATLVDVDIERTVPFNCVVRVADRDRVFVTLRDLGIGVGVHYPPNHLQPAFRPWHRPLPATETSAAQLLSLPFHLGLSDDDVHHVTTTLDKILYACSLSRRGGTR